MQGYAFQNWSNLVLRGTAWAMPTALYLAICLDNGTEPSWHDHASGTLDSSDSYNDKRKAGLVNGASETYGGYQRVKITFNSASGGRRQWQHQQPAMLGAGTTAQPVAQRGTAQIRD
jgi:hypothetical protein